MYFAAKSSYVRDILSACTLKSADFTACDEYYNRQRRKLIQSQKSNSRKFSR